VYYAVAHVALLRARRSGHIPVGWGPRIVATLGLAACIALVLALPFVPSLLAVALGLLLLAARWFAGWLERTRAALRETRR